MVNLIIKKIYKLNLKSKVFDFGSFGESEEKLKSFLLHMSNRDLLEVYNTLLRYDEQTEFKKYLLKKKV